jgi:hypothetical protein
VSTSLRKFIAMLMLLLGLVIYCMIAMRLMADVFYWPLWLKTFCYLVLGLVWIFPCYTLLTWMETGKWRKVKRKK